PVLLLALACGWLGFSDDFAKVKGQANKGISARLRLGVEALLGGLLGLVIVVLQDHPAQGIVMPQDFGLALVQMGLSLSCLSPSYVVDGTVSLAELTLPSIVVVLLSVFLVTATTNSVNLHDGMDGLAAGTSIMVLLSI